MVIGPFSPWMADFLRRELRGLGLRALELLEDAPQGARVRFDVPEDALDTIATLLRAADHRFGEPERVREAALSAARDLGLSARPAAGAWLDATAPDGAPRRFDLAVLALAEPACDDAALRARARELLERPPPPPAPPPPPVRMPRESLLPGLLTKEALRALVASLPDEARERIVLRVLPLCGELLAVVWLDHGARRELVTGLHERLWGRPLEDIFAQSLENLRGVLPALERHGALVRVTARDGDGAALVLSPGVRERVEALLGGPAAWALPSRDEAWAARRADEAALDALRATAAERHGAAARPLGADLLVLREGRFVPLGQEAGG